MSRAMSRATRAFGTAVLLAVALIAATFAVGWWGVPLVAFLWGVWAARPAPRGAARSATIAAMLAWGSLLVWTAARGPLTTLVTLLGQIAHAPGAALIVVTLLFPAALAWSATTVGGAVAALFGRRAVGAAPDSAL